MSQPLILAFCEPSERERVVVARDSVCPSAPLALPRIGEMLGGRRVTDNPLRMEHAMRAADPHRRAIFLGIGPNGCAALAACVAEHGVERVSAVVLIEPSAPSSDEPDLRKMRVRDEVHGGFEDDGPAEPRDLGPLEPMRELAKRSITYVGGRCDECGGKGYIFTNGSLWGCGMCAVRKAYGVRLVLAVCVEAPPCEKCHGMKALPGCGVQDALMCPACSGAGHGLSSAEVAGALLGEDAMPIDPTGALWTSRSTGGLQVFAYPTRATLAEHGLEAALQAVMGS